MALPRIVLFCSVLFCFYLILCSTPNKEGLGFFEDLIFVYVSRDTKRSQALQCKIHDDKPPILYYR
jgi:hypothetical protein